MTSELLPTAPRELSRALKRDIWWGNAAVLWSATNLFLVSLAFFFLLILYGVPPRAFLSPSDDVVRVESQLSARETESLPSGGKADYVVAQVKVNEVVLSVRGYGPQVEQAELGDKVEIVVPKSHPAEAFLTGFHPFAVSPFTLLGLAFAFSLPALLVVMLALLGAQRRAALLEHGVETEAEKTRTLPLPRPLKDKALVRWEFDRQGAKNRVWQLQAAEGVRPVLLTLGSKAALRDNLLASVEVKDGVLHPSSRRGLFLSGFNLILVMLSFLTFVAYVVL